MGSGEWGVGSGKWGVGSGEWGVGRSQFSYFPLRHEVPPHLLLTRYREWGFPTEARGAVPLTTERSDPLTIHPNSGE